MSHARDPYNPARTATIKGGWQERAACRKTPAEQVTRELCAGCPVADRECLRFVISLTNGDDPGGIVAGLNADERVQVRRELARRRAAKVEKTCTKCGEAKSGAEFYIRLGSTTRTESACLDCRRAEMRQSASKRRRRERAAAKRAVRPAARTADEEAA